MKKAVFGIAKSQAHAEEVIEKLQNSGFYSENISALFQNSKGTEGDNNLKSLPKHGAMGIEKHTKAAEGGASGAAIGGIIGGTIGLLAGIGSLAIPGLGAFIAAGPIMAALSGSAVGGSLGLLVGALTGMGIPEYEAKRYESRLRNGGVLLSVHVESLEEMDKVKHLFEKNGIEDISTSNEKIESRK